LVDGARRSNKDVSHCYRLLRYVQTFGEVGKLRILYWSQGVTAHLVVVELSVSRITLAKPVINSSAKRTRYKNIRIYGQNGTTGPKLRRRQSRQQSLPVHAKLIKTYKIGSTAQVAAQRAPKLRDWELILHGHIRLAHHARTQKPINLSVRPLPIGG